jgi:tellurite methyltransferase
LDQQEKWNRKYLEKISEAKEKEANKRLKKFAPILDDGGAAIDIACGLGVNSFFLASIGYKVTALDLSDIAIKFVEEQANKRKLDIQAYTADLTDTSNFSFQSESYDLAIITYYLDRSIFPVVKEMVKIDGYVFIETYYQTGTGSRQTISDKYKLLSNELLKEFRGWRILFYEECKEEGRQTIFCQKQ